ncbi:DUF2183 domain-containing protein [Leucothrix sargassi]|nr:DUF2183 domain-containing protein [Leucothrix sargassi]
MKKTVTDKVAFLKRLLRIAPSILLKAPSLIFHGSPIKTDEEVIFFPTTATQNQEDEWEIPVHVWLYEQHGNGLVQMLSVEAVAEILEYMDVSEEQSKLPVFQERMRWFLADNESNKRVNIKHDEQTHTSPRTGLNGHAQFEIKSTSGNAGDWVTMPVHMPEGDDRVFFAESQLIPRQGLSVISDIDDTLKPSNVLDKKALIQSVFLKDYHPVEGMPAFFQQLANDGAYFHYLSSSPWQIYPLLKPLLDKYYPKGSVNLRNFNPTNRSFFKFFGSSEVYKISKAMNIVNRYPEHQFILIGDSGERDPEVYARIYREFPYNIKQILIRAVEGSNLHKNRFEEVFADVPRDKWKVFSEPSYSLIED